MRLLYFSLLLMLVFAGCKKSEIEQIPNNEPPPDGTIDDVLIENYVNRAYILTLAREPDNTEFNTAVSLLSNAALDSASRQTFLQAIFTSPDYRPQVYHENHASLLNNVDTAEFSTMIYLFQLFLLDSSYQLQWPLIQIEIDRLVDLRNAYPDYVNGLIEIDSLHHRMCKNYFYDQINMGSANFVISTFQNLINRNPTASEQQAGISMVDGNNAILFLESGSSKDDYLRIFTHSQSYYEGQVILLYLKFLNRVPTTIEMANGTTKYSTTGDYRAVQYDILSTDEFIGL